MNRCMVTAVDKLDRFLFRSCDPRTASLIRIAYAVLMIINSLVYMRDARMWFTDAGVLSADTAWQMSGGEQLSLLYLLPSTVGIVQACLGMLLLHSILLLLGCWSRVQIACIFLWLLSLHHRNPLICDGEDTVFRWFAFLMIFMPLDCRWSIIGRWRGIAHCPASACDAWALRLMQIEVTLIYGSTAWNKWQGETWQNGTALYYVSHMTDYFGRLPVPLALSDSLWFIHVMTWSVLVVETILPFALWWRPTRVLAIVVAIALHLGIEASMNLFLFEWIMIVGVLSFLPASRMKATTDAASNTTNSAVQSPAATSMAAEVG